MINLHEYLSIGQNAVIQKVVQPADTSEKYISPFKELLASPKLIHWAIDASVNAIDPYLPEEYASIGLAVNFVHTAPTSVGTSVTVHVVISEITETEVSLTVKAWDEQGEIGNGILKRAVVEVDVVKQKAKERTKFITSRRLINWSKDSN